MGISVNFFWMSSAVCFALSIVDVTISCITGLPGMFLNALAVLAACRCTWPHGHMG